MTQRNKEFEEIANSGGKVTFTISTTEDGRQTFQVGFRTSRPVPSVMVGLYALPQGIPVGRIHLGGIGQPWNPPPFPDCVPVLMASDSTGRFGHNCPACRGYWRSGPWPNVCPYCRVEAEGYQFLSEAQARYVRHYCEVLFSALQGDDGEVEIDMDAVADAADRESEKPAFYVSDQSQQRKFTCTACDEFNDILGRFGYCSSCGTRNDLADFESATVSPIREQLNKGSVPEDCLRSAVSAFDSLVGQLAKELARLVPLTERRTKRLSTQRFHNLDEMQQTFRDWFDIDIGASISEADWAFNTRMFHRRHVYEHNGGVVDEKYLEDSGDATVRLRQHIHETREDVHNLLGGLQRIVRNLHRGFHELIPPLSEPISEFEARKAHREALRRDQS